jgi:hypothetical protein
MAASASIGFAFKETWLLQITCLDASGAPLDLTGATAIRWRLGLDGITFLDLSLGDGITVVGAASAGVFEVVVTPDMQTAAAITPALYLFEAQVVLADGTVSDVISGSFNVRPTLF